MTGADGATLIFLTAWWADQFEPCYSPKGLWPWVGGQTHRSGGLAYQMAGL